MGILSDFTNKIKFKNTEEYKKYLCAIENNKKDIARMADYIQRYQAEIYNLLNNGVSRESKEFKFAYDQLQRWQYEYKKFTSMTPFFRPNNQGEIEERNRIADTFGDALLNIVGENSELRFHGTPIYFAEQIIKDKKISSSADRHNGYMSSTDLPGEISASVISDINRTINYFTDFGSYNRSLPCGVLFVLNEKDGDKELRGSREMKNVDFASNPEQLVSIVCTSEVKAMVSNWCMNSNIDLNKVFTYDEFLEYAKNSALQKTAELPIISEEKTR